MMRGDAPAQEEHPGEVVGARRLVEARGLAKALALTDVALQQAPHLREPRIVGLARKPLPVVVPDRRGEVRIAERGIQLASVGEVPVHLLHEPAGARACAPAAFTSFFPHAHFASSREPG